MVCDRCGYYKSKGYNFCTECGQDLSDPSIQTQFDGSNYEVSEFYPTQYAKKKQKLENVFFVLGLIITVAASVLLFIELIVMITGAPSVFNNIGNMVNGDNPPVFFIVVPLVYGLFYFNEPGLTVYYIFLLAAAVFSAVLYFAYGAKELVKIPKDGGKSAFNTAMVEMPILFGAMFLLELIYIFIVVGPTDIAGPDSNPVYENLYSLLNASVWEEILTRFCFIGIPMGLAYYFFRREKFSPKMFFGGFGMSETATFFIIISSVIFGIAHLSNWPLWKFVPTFFFGLLAGYLFVKYGLYASIMMHFINDYISAESWITGSDSPLMTLTLIGTMMILSIPFFYYYGKKFVAYIKKVLNSESPL